MQTLGRTGIFAAVLGNGFEFYDFGVYAAYVGMIGRAFYPNGTQFESDLASAATFGVGFVARPLGGILIGAYADRAGRKPAMTLTMALMALGSAAIAVLPGYATIGLAAPIILILARLVQGFAAGGELAPATLFMIEAAPPGRRMFYGSWQIASQALGHLAVGLSGFLLARVLSEDSLHGWGWRLPFMLGICVGPIGLYIRSRLGETLVREAGTASAKTGAALTAVLTKNWRSVVLGVGMICGGVTTNYFLVNMTFYATRTLHLPASTAILSTVALGGAGVIGALAGGRLADRFGIKPISIVAIVVASIAILPAMRVLVAAPGAATLVLVVAILSLLHGVGSSIGVILISQAFPPAIRATGLALTSALGVMIFGGTASYVFTWVVGVTGDPLASAYYVLAAKLAGLASVLAIREYSSAPVSGFLVQASVPVDVASKP